MHHEFTTTEEVVLNLRCILEKVKRKEKKEKATVLHQF